MPPPYEFKGPEDKPRRARYRKTADGFVASAPCSTWLMAVVTAAVTAFLGSILWRGQSFPNVPASFSYVVGAMTGISLLTFCYYVFGRVRVTVRGELLTITRTVLGLGVPKRVALRDIVHFRVLNRRERYAMGHIAGATVGWRIGPTMSEQVCEIETDKTSFTWGGQLQPRQLYYLRFLIIAAIKEMRASATTEQDADA